MRILGRLALNCRSNLCIQTKKAEKSQRSTVALRNMRPEVSLLCMKRLPILSPLTRESSRSCAHCHPQTTQHTQKTKQNPRHKTRNYIIPSFQQVILWLDLSWNDNEQNIVTLWHKTSGFRTNLWIFCICPVGHSAGSSIITLAAFVNLWLTWINTLWQFRFETSALLHTNYRVHEF